MLVVTTIAVLAGCGAMDRQLQRDIARQALGISPPVEDDAEVERVAVQAAEGNIPAQETVDVPANAGLDDYVRIALERNPGIRQAVRSLQALGYRVPQVTSLEDPMINLLPPTGDMTQTAAGMMEASVGISQKIPFPGRLTKRGQVAEQQVRMAFAGLADARVRTAAQVASAYYDYYLADVSIAITHKSESLLHQMRDVASARYRTGSATQQDVLRAEVELYGLTNDVITLEQKRTTARARLNTLMNRAVAADLPRPGSFELKVVDWKLPAALDRAVVSNPQLAGLRDQVRRDLETIRLARLDYFPDLRIGFGYSIIGSGISPVASGSDNWSLPLGLNLPIWWQRLRAQVLEANARTLASVEKLTEMRNLIFFAIQDTLVKIDTEYRQGVLYRDVIVPRALQTVEVSTAAYQTGDLEFTALIDNWRNWLNFSLAYHRALAGLEQRFADLQQLVGIQLPRVEDGSGATGDAAIQTSAGIATSAGDDGTSE